MVYLYFTDLTIERFCMTGGKSPIGYLKAYMTNLYLSKDAQKVTEAIEEGKTPQNSCFSHTRPNWKCLEPPAVLHQAQLVYVHCLWLMAPFYKWTFLSHHLKHRSCGHNWKENWNRTFFSVRHRCSHDVHAWYGERAERHAAARGLWRRRRSLLGRVRGHCEAARLGHILRTREGVWEQTSGSGNWFSSVDSRHKRSVLSAFPLFVTGSLFGSLRALWRVSWRLWGSSRGNSTSKMSASTVLSEPSSSRLAAPPVLALASWRLCVVGVWRSTRLFSWLGLQRGLCCRKSNLTSSLMIRCSTSRGLRNWEPYLLTCPMALGRSTTRGN